MASESRTALRYLTGFRALPWAISTLILRLVRSPRATLEALLRKVRLNHHFPLNVWHEYQLPIPIRKSLPHASVNPIPNSVLHFVTNSLPYTQAGYTVRTQSILTAQLNAGMNAAAVTRYGYPINIGKFFTGTKTDIRTEGSEKTVTYHHLIPQGLATNYELENAAKYACKLVQKLRPEVIHAATDFVNGEIASAVAKATDLPFAYEVRGFLEQSWLAKDKLNSTDSPFYQDFLSRENAVMQQANAITTLSETMKNEIIKRGISSEKIYLTPNAVSDNLLQINKSPSQARLEIGLSELPTFGIISTLYPFENTSLLIAALEKLEDSGRQAQLVIVGDGPDLLAVKDRAYKSRVKNRIYFFGRIPNKQISSYYQALDVFCVPRTRSRVTELVTPLKPLEAMALNRPVLASNLPALAELISSGETGLLVEPDSLSALTDSLDRLLYDSDYRMTLSSKAREWVAANRTWSQVAQTYRQVYQQLSKQ